MIAIAVDAAKEATCERSRPRPITTTAMPRARIPRIEMLRARAKKFPRLRKPLRKTEKRTIRIAHIAKTASVWVGFRACAADPPLTFQSQILIVSPEKIRPIVSKSQEMYPKPLHSSQNRGDEPLIGYNHIVLFVR